MNKYFPDIPETERKKEVSDSEEFHESCETLASALQSKDLDAATLAFAELLAHRETMPAEQLSLFADLSHDYIQKILLDRDEIQHRGHPSGSADIKQTRTLLAHYQQLMHTLQQRFSQEDWMRHYIKAGEILWEKGYVEAETDLWTETKTLSSRLPGSAIEISQHIEWQDYYLEAERRLNSELTAALTILSQKVEKATTALDVAALASSGFIPVAGAIVGAVTIGLYDVVKHRTAAEIAYWVVSAVEAQRLSAGLAQALLVLRQETLLQLKTQDFSFLTRIGQQWQALFEKQTFSLAQKLALGDVFLIINKLLPACQAAKTLDEKTRVEANIATLLQAFQIHLNDEQEDKRLSLPLFTKKTLPSAAHELMEVAQRGRYLAFTHTSELAHAWLYWQAVARQPGEEKNWRLRLSQLEKLGSRQQLKAYWNVKYQQSLQQLLSTRSPRLRDVDKLRQDAARWLTIPGHSQEGLQAFWKSVAIIWSTEKSADLSRQAMTQDWSMTDEEEMSIQMSAIIDFLIQHDQVTAAQQQLLHYQAALQDRLEEVRKKYTLLTTRLAELKKSQGDTEFRNQQWLAALQSWIDELKGIHTPATDNSSSLISVTATRIATTGALLSTTTQSFTADMKAVFKQEKPWAIIEKQYAEQYALWRQQQRQQLPQATETFQSLLDSLISAQTALIELQKQDSARITEQQQQNEALVAAQEWLQTLEKLMTTLSTRYRTLTSKNVIQDIIYESTVSVSEEKNSLADLIQITERDLGEPPCGFAVMRCCVTLTREANTQTYGAYTSTESAPFALLIDEGATRQHPYWFTYARLLRWRWQCHPSFLQQIPNSVWIAAPATMARIVLTAEALGSSQTQAVKAAQLFSIYQKSVSTSLTRASPTEGTPRARVYGYYGLQFLFNQPLPALDDKETSLSVADAFIQPLRNFCLHLGLYYMLPAAALESPHSILSTLIRRDFDCHYLDLNYLSTAFIADLQAALTWSAKYAQKLLNKLTKMEHQQLQQHHQLTLSVLWQTGEMHEGVEPVWNLTRKLPPQFDPLLAVFDKTRDALKQGHIIPEKVENTLNFLVQVIGHRSQFSWDDQQRYYWDIPLNLRQAYLEVLAKILPPEQQSFIARLRHLPNTSGWRLEQELEKQAWDIALQGWRQPTTVLDGVDEIKEIKTVSMSRVKFVPAMEGFTPVVETYPLHSAIAKQLFSTTGEWREKDKTLGGNHRVYPVRIDGAIHFWVKVYPEQPGLEYLVTELDRRLGIQGTPMMELVKFSHGDQTSAAVITAAIPGRSLHTLLEDKRQAPSLDRLPLAAFVSVLLRVLLTNPEDDKGDDYFLVLQLDGSYRLIRIDNERAFFQPTADNQGWLFKSSQLLVKSMLYCLEHMQTEWGADGAVAAVVEDFLQLQPIAVISHLLTAADQLHDGWNRLFTEGEVATHFECRDPWASLPVMCIPQGLAKELITRFTAMSTALRMNAQQMSGLQLLRVTQPKLAQYYRKAHEIKYSAHDHSVVKKRFQQVTGGLYRQDAYGHSLSQIPHSIAMQSSLRLESPIDQTILLEIRAKRTGSAQQELKQFMQWQKQALQRLLDELLKLNPAARAEFQGLPLRHQAILMKKLLKITLNMDQQRFVLAAMTGIAWPELDLSLFKTILTDGLLEPLLQAAGEQLLSITLNGCRQLTLKSLAVILRHNTQCQILAAQQVPWLQVSINQLPQLQRLDLSGSPIEILIVQALRLRELDVRNCRRLQRIGARAEPFKAPNLQRVSLAGCQVTQVIAIEGESLNRVVDELSQCPSLRTLDIQTGAMGLIPVPAFLIDAMHKQERAIKPKTALTAPQFRNLTAILFQDRYITALDLGGNDIGDRGIQALATALQINTTLTDLNLQYNKISAAGMTVFAALLKIKSSLHNLDLRHNPIGVAGAEALATALAVAGGLVMLNLDSSSIGDPGTQAIATALTGNVETRLNDLNLENNGVTAVGATALADLLKTNTSLSHLDLKRNRIGDAGAQALARGLAINKTLTHLNLHSNQINHSGAQALAEALSTSGLIELNLEGNTIGNGGAQAFAAALKTNTKITHLNLESNHMDDAGAQALAEMLRINPHLTCLNLGYNEIHADGAQALAAALKTNTTLTRLNLKKNTISGAGGLQALKDIDSYLKRNQALTIQPTLPEKKAVKEEKRVHEQKFYEQDNPPIHLSSLQAQFFYSNPKPPTRPRTEEKKALFPDKAPGSQIIQTQIQEAYRLLEKATLSKELQADFLMRLAHYEKYSATEQFSLQDQKDLQSLLTTLQEVCSPSPSSLWMLS